MQQKENILGTEKIGKLLVKFAVPGIVSMVVNSLYNIVDQVFIGQGVGYLGNGATNVIFPMTTLAMAFALLIGDGAASYMSLKLGQRDQEAAARGTAAGMLASLAFGVLIAVIYTIFMEPLCRLFGATDGILPYAKQYGYITAIGIPFASICCAWSSLIRADGSPRYIMIGLLTGCAFNLVFDPIFIFVLHWGVKGAALATILGQIANAILNIIYIPRYKTVRITKPILRTCLPTVPRVAKLGISSFIQQIVIVVSMAVQNNLLVSYGATSQYGADIPMTALGVTMKVFNIMMAIVIGLAAGSQPILGYNYGSGQYDRVKKTFRCVVAVATAVMTIGFLCFQIIPRPIVSIFGTDSEMYTLFSVKCLRIFLLAIPFGALQMVSGIFFQALGRPLQASILSLSKQILFQIPAMLLYCRLIGVEGSLWAGPTSDVLCFILTVILLLTSWKSMFGNSPFRKEQTN